MVVRFQSTAIRRKLIGGQRIRTDMPERFFQDIRLTLAQMKLVLCREKLLYCYWKSGIQW